ncbi:hypothetical protein [Halospeciosus flavus]|uniref:hypothetical protein n=1 Tax=Halospeciosus flavus TaxID=3032283 RepID=UPI0036D41850
MRVERDGEVVHTSSQTLEEKSGQGILGAVADCTWDTVPGEYVVFARADDGKWTQRTLTAPFESPPECVVVSVRYGGPTHVDPEDPLAVVVDDQCEEIDEFVGGCPEYR